MRGFVLGALVIGACLATGEAAARWLHLPLPGNLVGMVLMAAVLLLTEQAFIINRLAGLPYPAWAPPAEPLPPHVPHHHG